MGKKVRVDVKGIVVDENTEEITEDFEDWVCLKDVSVKIDKDEITQSDHWGNFSFSKLHDPKTDPSDLIVCFVNDKYNQADININIPNNTLAHNINLLIKLKTRSFDA